MVKHQKNNKQYKKSQCHHLRHIDPSKLRGNRISMSEYQALLSINSKESSPIKTDTNPRRTNKFNAKKTRIDGILFDSKLEGQRYVVLKDKLKRGFIRDLELQVSFDIVINEIKICSYIADFCYYCSKTDSYIVEDAKGRRHPVYQLKKKMMLACHGISIVEITKDIVNN